MTTVITDDCRAGHAIRIRATKLAEAAVAEQYRAHPDLADRYGPDGRRYCIRDVAHHVQFLAASVELADPRRFADYVAWARRVLIAYRIPAADFLGSLRALRAVARDHLPPAVADGACRHIDAALAAWPDQSV
jgi:hypothetical protein